MKHKILFFVLAVSMSAVKGQFNSCTITDDNSIIDWENREILLTLDRTIKDIDTINIELPFTGNLSATSESPYISATTANNVIKIQTTDQYDRIEEVFRDDRNNDLTSTITFTCEGEGSKPLAWTLYLLDTNNHKPIFNEASYTYMMPSPIPPNIEITNYGTYIFVEDVDFSNSDIILSITDTSDKFAVSTATGKSGRYHPSLVVKQFLCFEDDIELEIIATDNGTPPQTSDPVTITIKKNNSSISCNSCSISN